eukprot:2403838-Pleurochrysis_carterae.AAC.1
MTSFLNCNFVYVPGERKGDMSVPYNKVTMHTIWDLTIHKLFIKKQPTNSAKNKNSRRAGNNRNGQSNQVLLGYAQYLAYTHILSHDLMQERLANTIPTWNKNFEYTDVALWVMMDIMRAITEP